MYNNLYTFKFTFLQLCSAPPGPRSPGTAAGWSRPAGRGRSAQPAGGRRPGLAARPTGGAGSRAEPQCQPLSLPGTSWSGHRGAAHSAAQEAAVATAAVGRAAGPGVPPGCSGLGLAMAALGLSERERAGCRDLLELLETEELIALTDTVTSRLVHPESRQGARSPGRERPAAALPAPGPGCWDQP